MSESEVGDRGSEVGRRSEIGCPKPKFKSGNASEVGALPPTERLVFIYWAHAAIV